MTEIYNFLPISDRIFTSGQPTPEQFATLQDAGCEVVINLAMPTSSNAIPNEGELVAIQGMDYVHIPVEWEAPTLEDLQQFFAVMRVHRERVVLVHCAMNMRVSAFVYLYRRLELGASEAEALPALHQIWTPNEIWQRFIDLALQSDLTTRG
jgi:protein tyrosine phosphatase (PTP) superfamily phosphohydrolase (DUF442 family)